MCYVVSVFSFWIDYVGKDGGVEILMKIEVNGLDIYYILDGIEFNL